MTESRSLSESWIYDGPDDEGVFCHLPWLFRLYDRASGYFQSDQDETKSIPLLKGRKSSFESPETTLVRSPGSFLPSRLVHPDGHVDVISGSRTEVPNYKVISYTWGRWMREDRSQDTKLEGCHWKVPSTTLFSREELDRVIRTIAGGYHIWLDVFCIPQGDRDPEKAQEISRQGDIFSNAAGAAVWLCSGGGSVLQNICSWTDDQFSRPALDLAPSSRMELKDSTVIRLEILRSIPAAVPWTTSLWTLQEAALRRDAVFHDKDGQVVREVETGAPLTVRDLIRAFTQIETELLIFKMITDWMTVEDRALFDAATAAVKSVALSNLDNMNARELYLASEHRVCQRDHDRVYAIMNALGVIVPIDYTAPLEAIKQTFLLELYRNYPAEMHSFLKTVSEPLDASLEFGLHSRSLSQMRQLERPGSSNGSFIGVTPEGLLVVSGAMNLDNNAVEALCSAIKEYTAAVCYDDKGQDRLTLKEDWPAQQMRTARNLKGISKYRRIVLLYLGTLEPTAHLGSTFAYLLCLQNQIQKSFPEFIHVYRIGLLVSKAVVKVDQTQTITVTIKP
ncbi:hypothetical protein BDV96DRAFT_561280 [Lophiotrema nucula]|uniref:Heterokaryon incompatibility domain-containing protein n=1 Tax=Lophiotrema nucula TaxID=690887 RepID=A0A6A5ZTA4_9PLEO|nr:hypothetical protein BDV96DRAFT_561280 [Lophiotrema nucula]